MLQRYYAKFIPGDQQRYAAMAAPTLGGRRHPDRERGAAADKLIVVFPSCPGASGRLGLRMCVASARAGGCRPGISASSA